LYVSNNIIAVADGVGGWKNYGVDAGEYSKNLIGLIDKLTKDK
jgi:serine/threonine protein phosphatase PrpC